MNAVRADLTRERLWFLYSVAGLIKADIEELTGWSRKDIDGGLRRWRLTTYSPADTETRIWLDERAGALFGIPLSFERIDDLSAARDRLRAQVQRALFAKPIDWATIDGSAMPAEVSAVAKAGPSS